MALLAAALLLAPGCAESHTAPGDAAGTDAGALVAPRLGEPCTPLAVPPGGFSSREVYTESYTPVCGEPYFEGFPTRPPIGTCVVYHLEGDPRPECAPGTCADPAEASFRTFCSCRCGGDPGTGPFCTCGEGFRCERLVESGRYTEGSYCVPADLPIGR